MSDYYICVLDFEATCCNKNEFPRNQMEIIEFPSILYKISNHKVEFISQFHKYVKPTIHPILTNFCTELTGITQNMVDEVETIEKIYDEHIKWLNDNLPKDAKLIFATCGHWDLKTMLPNEIYNKKLKLNNFYKKYINVKDEYQYFYKQKAYSMKNMLDYLKITLDGRLHSGIDDTKNISKILLKMIDNGHENFKVNYVK